MEKKTEEKKIDYTEWFRKIIICLYVVIAVLVLNTILTIASMGSNNSNTEQNNEGTLSYDTSKFNEMTTSEIMQAIQSNETQVIFIGRSGCGYCTQFIPILDQAQEAFGFKAIYLDLDKVTADDQKQLIGLDSYVETNFGYTPFVILAKDGKYVNGQVGYVEYDKFADFLKANGFTEK